MQILCCVAYCVIVNCLIFGSRRETHDSICNYVFNTLLQLKVGHHLRDCKGPDTCLLDRASCNGHVAGPCIKCVHGQHQCSSFLSCVFWSWMMKHSSKLNQTQARCSRWTDCRSSASVTWFFRRSFKRCWKQTCNRKKKTHSYSGSTFFGTVCSNFHFVCVYHWVWTPTQGFLLPCSRPQIQFCHSWSLESTGVRVYLLRKGARRERSRRRVCE